MARTPATAPVTITVTVELPHRTYTEQSTLPMPTVASWAGPLDCADEIRALTARMADRFRLTLPEEWQVDTTGRATRASRTVRRVLRAERNPE